MKCWIVVALLVLLIVLHQDYWNWYRTDLVAGAVPWTLMWHMGLSLAAAVVWWLATRWCWPQGDSDPSGTEQSP